MSRNAHRSVRLDIWVEISIVEPSELGGMDNKFSESALISDRAMIVYATHGLARVHPSKKSSHQAGISINFATIEFISLQERATNTILPH